jgi:acyl carrier protein
MVSEHNSVQDQLSSENVERKLRDIIARVSFTRVLTDAIRATDALADIGIDSLAFMEVVVCMEEEFGITVPDQDLALERFDTVESLKSYILARLRASDPRN